MEEPPQPRLHEGKLIAAREIEGDIRGFLSAAEIEQIEKENDYMLRGPGRIEKIMQDEIDKLGAFMEEKIRQQDEEFLNKLSKR